MQVTRKTTAGMFPDPLGEDRNAVYHVLLSQFDNITKTMLLDDLLLCKDFPTYVTYANEDNARKVWRLATEYLFDGYMVEARTLRRQLRVENKERVRVLLGRGVRDSKPARRFSRR